MRNDITRVALVATEPEIIQNEVFWGPSRGRWETYVFTYVFSYVFASPLETQSRATENLYVIFLDGTPLRWPTSLWGASHLPLLKGAFNPSYSLVAGTQLT